LDAKFYKEFLKADVVTLGRPAEPSRAAEGFQHLREDTPFRIQLLAYKGEPVVAIFSSMKRMTDVIPEKYYRGTGFIQLKCETLLKIMMASDPKSKFTLNPGHMVVKTFSPEEVNALLNGAIFKELEDARIARNTPRQIQLPKGAQVLVGRPKAIPTTLINKLAEYFQASGNVEQAWLGEILVPSSGQPAHLLVCIRLSKNSQRTFDEFSVDIGPTIRSILGQKEFLDVSDANGQTKELLDKLIPFFPK
jgi:type III secretion system (T3SS) SseB-like protein